MLGNSTQSDLVQCSNCKQVKQNVRVVELSSEGDFFAGFMGPKRKKICNDCIKDHNKKFGGK